MMYYKAIAPIPKAPLKDSILFQCRETSRFFMMPIDGDEAEAFIALNSTAQRYYSEIGLCVGDFYRPIKLFIDFDWTPEAKIQSTSTDIFNNFILPALMEYMRRSPQFASTLRPEDFLFFPMDAADRSKISFHCVMNNGYYFQTMTDHRLFMENFRRFVATTRSSDAHLNKYVERFDWQRWSMGIRPTTTTTTNDGEERRGVYFQLRAPLCAKEGRRKRIPQGHQFIDSLVLYYGKEKPRFIESIEMPRSISQQSTVIHYAGGKSEFFWVPENQREALQLLEKVCPYDHQCIEINQQRPFNSRNIIEFRRVSGVGKTPASCTICKGSKRSHNSKLPYAYLSEASVHLKCFSNQSKGNLYPSIRLPIKYATARKGHQVNEDRLTILQGKVICVQYGYAILKSSGGGSMTCLKGSAVVEMLCPLFYWTVEGIREKEPVKFAGQSLDTYHLARVKSVKLLCLKNGGNGEWTADSWRSFSLTSVVNCLSDVKYPSGHIYQYYKDHRNDPLRTFIDKHEQELRNCWMTEQSLLRLCNEYPDSFRVGQVISVNEQGDQTKVIDCSMVHGIPMSFDRCAQLFDQPGALRSLMTQITITPRYVEYIRSATDYDPSIHDKKIELALFYQERLAAVQRECATGDRMLPLVIPSQGASLTLTDISQFFLQYDDSQWMECTCFESQWASKFGITTTVKPEDMVVVVFMREYIETFRRIITTLDRLPLVEDHSVTASGGGSEAWRRVTGEQRCYQLNNTTPRTFADTVLFINDALELSGEQPYRVNPEHMWSHLRVLWEYRRASLDNRLTQWKDQLFQSVTNALTDPLFSGSLLYILLFSYDRPPS